MRIMTDVRCQDCDSVSEHWISEEELAALDCPVCTSPNTRKIIGAPHIAYTQMATDGSASSDACTTAIDRWVRMRDQKARIEKRNMDRHGTID